MQESAAAIESVTNGTDPGANGTRESTSPRRNDTGFTAVNGAHKTVALFRPSDPTGPANVSPDTRSTPISTHEISQYHSHGWKSHESNANGGHGESEAPNAKRKRSDQQDRLRTIANGWSKSPDGIHSGSPSSRPNAMDSVIDLTSDQSRPPREASVIDSDDSDVDHEAVYSRTKSPVERWNRGEPPPRPRPETEEKLSASLQQYQESQQARDTQNNLSYSPDYHSPAGERDYVTGEYVTESHVLSDEQYNGDAGDAKRRKRNFSNRTKTGCHTCRQRKKKCDEGKPRCQNCERGNFNCLGYGPRPPGLKTANQTRAVVPLQSKIPMAPYNGRHTDGPPIQPTEGTSYSHWGKIPDQHLHPAGPLAPPSSSEGDPQRHFVAVAPAGARPQSGMGEDWHKGSYPPAHEIRPSRYFDDRLPPNFPPTPSHSQYSHDQRQTPPRHLHQYPALSHGPPLPSSSSAHHHSSSHPPPPPLLMEPWGPHPSIGPYPPHHLTAHDPVPPPLPAGSSRASAASLPHRSDSFHLGYLSSHSLVEKDKMLRGQPYLHYLDPVLCQERQSCKAAVERYNKAAETTSGISDSERGKLFTQILKPHKRVDTKPKESQHPAPNGSIGDHSIVEPSFTCEYGYNIHIGSKCIVESGCFFQDAANIFLGHRVVIGHNVKLYCRTVPLDPSARNKGSRSNMIAGAIKIEDDCFIGADVVIMPFVTIGKGAVVGAGSIVTKDVEENTVVAGNPAKLIRRIEGDNMGRHHSQQVQKQQEKMIARMVSHANSGFNWSHSPRL